MGNILEEAVNDVQALKRAAEENAKNLLVEAMSPRIKDFIQSHLGQEGVDAAMALDTDEQNGMQQPTENDHNADMYEIDVNEGDDDDDDDDEGVPSPKHHDEENCDDDEDDGVDIEMTKEATAQGDPDAEDDDEVDESVEITHEDLQKAFAEVLKQGLKKEAATSLGDVQDPNDGEYGLAHKVPGEVMWADGEKVIKKSKNAKMVTKEQYEKTIKVLQQKLAQYTEAFKYLKKNLNEMNLFNAKLIYTTRLMQGNLSNKQKMAVVESIDNAKNKHEVELVYKTLSESLKIAGALNENKKTGIKGPKASRFTKPSSTVMNESVSNNNPTASRWAELAGLVE